MKMKNPVKKDDVSLCRSFCWPQRKYEIKFNQKSTLKISKLTKKIATEFLNVISKFYPQLIFLIILNWVITNFPIKKTETTNLKKIEKIKLPSADYRSSTIFGCGTYEVGVRLGLQPGLCDVWFRSRESSILVF
jgi:hypothetical protein